MKIKIYEKCGVISPSADAALRAGPAALPPNESEAEVFVLCAGRHAVPEGLEGKTDYVFHYIDDPMDFAALAAAAEQAFKKVRRGERVYIYVTGLTSALIAALNALRKKAAKVTLMHYNSRTLGYCPQNVY